MGFMGFGAAWQRLVFLFAGFAAACLLAGCCKKRTPIDDNRESLTSANLAGLEAPGALQRDAKLDRIIKCFNAAMRINGAANNYFVRLGGGSPRPGRVPSILFAPTPGPAQTCLEAKAGSTPMMAEIDKLMPRYVDLVASLAQQLEEMDRYYTNKEYLRDAFRRGREMHEVFKSEHEEFHRLHGELAECIDEVADKRDDQLIELAARSAGLRYFSLVFLRDAKTLVRELASNEPDAVRVAEGKSQVLEGHQVLTDHATNHPDQVRVVFMFTTYRSRVDTFVDSLRTMDCSRLVDRDLDNVIGNYNAMIDASNLVRWQP